MTKHETIILTAYTGILLAPVSEYRKWLSENNLPDPFISFSPDMTRRLTDDLKEQTWPEVEKILNETWGGTEMKLMGSISYIYRDGKLKCLSSELESSPEETFRKLNELEEGVRSGWVTKIDGTVFMSTADKHNSVTSELHDIWKKKNADYGNSFKDLREEYPESILIRIGDKYNRLKTLMKQKEEVKDESVEDTLKDLANYCIMELIERQENKDISELKKPTTGDMEVLIEVKK